MKIRYHDDFCGTVQVELDTDKNSCNHHGRHQRACHTDDNVFPGNTWLLPAIRVASSFRLESNTFMLAMNWREIRPSLQVKELSQLLIPLRIVVTSQNY